MNTHHSCDHHINASLIFKGAVEASYNGEKEVIICIPKIKLSDFVPDIKEFVREVLRNDQEIFDHFKEIVSGSEVNAATTKAITDAITTALGANGGITTAISNAIKAALGEGDGHIYLKRSGDSMNLNKNIDMNGGSITNVTDVSSK